VSDSEFDAMRVSYEALAELDPAAQQRVLKSVASRLGLGLASPKSGDSSDCEADEAKPDPSDQTNFEEFGELFDAVDAKTDADKALAAAYWIMVHGGSESFNSHSVNAELKNLGHGIGNVTRAIDSLLAQKPSLAIQTKKSGTSKQARKTFKITRAGVELIESRVNASS